MAQLENHLETLSQKFEPSARPVTNATDVPAHWQGYLNESLAERVATARQELSRIEPYFPNTAKGLDTVLSDAFLARTDYHGLCRFLVVTLAGKEYLTYSRALKSLSDTNEGEVSPLFSQRAPKALVWVYETVMDGLTDLHDFTGFKSSLAMTAMASDDVTWAELSWYGAFAGANDTSKMVEILNSGGGGYLILDLFKDLRDVFEPQALLVDVKADSALAPRSVDLFPYLTNGWPLDWPKSIFDPPANGHAGTSEGKQNAQLRFRIPPDAPEQG